jgi:intracellular multiplication protein IcmD
MTYNIFRLILVVIATYANATATINSVADGLIGQLSSVSSLIAMANYVAGFSFLCVSIFKFKQHKDNPTQQTIGNPLMYLLLAILLMYMANIIKPIGVSLFGTGIRFGKYT